MAQHSGWLLTPHSILPGQPYTQTARVKRSTHILLIVNPLITLLRRRKQWEEPWLRAGWAPSAMGCEILAHDWPWVIGSLSCVPERTAGNHRPWFHSCGNNLSRGCMTVVVQLFPNGCLSVSVGLCLSWPVGTWNPSWLSQCYRGRRIHFLSLRCLFWILQPFCTAPSCCSKTCLWAVGTQGPFTLATASRRANKRSLKWSWFLSEQNIYPPATNTLCLALRFPISWYKMVPQSWSYPSIFHVCVNIIPLLTRSCWTQCLGCIHFLKNLISVFL